ncbi:SDR family NAD(P)-dependent oxidoreductase [Endozoicomonas arenosclerae]|uniref:SDR family NAD(P)-dependent oxidoreductase n=1 Tax=Endozoicomonas arenosclerae TaxID=1633495 RepID=UPI000783ADA4|nr:SDR family oxidoreductase [Endozoicomonas arenosclerae]
MAEQKKVVITGGSSGIGESLVRQFAKAGYEVLFSYCRGGQRARDLCEELCSYPVSCGELDQGDPASLQKFINGLPDNIFALIINGGLGSKTVEKVSSDLMEQDRALMQVNALGPMWLCRSMIPVMEKQGQGKVILMSSVGGGVSVFPGFRLADQMSKAALVCMGRLYAATLASSSVDLFTVCPGATDTPMFQSSTTGNMSEAELEGFADGLPGRRLIEADEIAELCLYLCSAQGQVLRGSVLDASLGLGSAPWMIKKSQEQH